MWGWRQANAVATRATPIVMCGSAAAKSTGGQGGASGTGSPNGGPGEAAMLPEALVIGVPNCISLVQCYGGDGRATNGNGGSGQRPSNRYCGPNGYGLCNRDGRKEDPVLMGS